MAHRHSDGCACNKRRVKRKNIRSGKTTMGLTAQKPMFLPNINVAAPFPYSVPGAAPHMAPYGSPYNPRVVVQSNREEAAGGLPTRAATNTGSQTSHIELRAAPRLQAATQFMVPRPLPRPVDAAAQTVTASGDPTALFTHAGRPTAAGAGTNPYALAHAYNPETDVGIRYLSARKEI